MALADTFERIRTGLIHITFLDKEARTLARGTGFLSRGYLVTNHHVFLGPKDSNVFLRRDGEDQGLLAPYKEFASRLKTGSQENSYDYAVLEIPEIIAEGSHQFELERPDDRRVGEPIALVGFPLEHKNLTCHAGIISSFYRSGITDIIQVDASVNSGISGGPLIDPETGQVLGVVTRKNTGLSRLFSELRDAISGNISFIERETEGAGHWIGDYSPIEGAIAAQAQILVLLDEIERQANVGIGYAMSSSHLLDDGVFQ